MDLSLLFLGREVYTTEFGVGEVYFGWGDFEQHFCFIRYACAFISQMRIDVGVGRSLPRQKVCRT